VKFEKTYKIAPIWFQNLMVTAFNYLAYKDRYGGLYAQYRDLYIVNRTLSLKELKAKQEELYTEFIEKTMKTSTFYKEAFKEVNQPELLSNISKLPIVDKGVLQSQITKVYTIPKSDGFISKTGGTTGTSLEVIFTKDDVQKRFGMLDAFRASFGYRLGIKTAWFSGKAILTPKDAANKNFWKTDYLHKVRYYSTFHIQSKHILYYINDLKKYKPAYIVGFPSTLLEIARYGLAHNITFDSGIVKAIFPTAEQVDDYTRSQLEAFFKTNVYDQYASSEGAPFIIECKQRNLHLELQSGVFEVLDANDSPAMEGRLVVTSFTTNGTPLIRYDIGDALVLSDEVCTCGNNNPLVEKILGRSNDFIYSEAVGKINLGNLSNALKDVNGVLKFQAIQDEKEAITILLVKDPTLFSEKDQRVFMENLRARVGDKMHIDLKFVDEIANEASGKFRMIKNNIKGLKV
jgi:phenylacetate-CoA ligase